MRGSSIHRDHGDEDPDALYTEASELEAKANKLAERAADLVDALLEQADSLRREADDLALDDLPYEPEDERDDDIVTISAPPGTRVTIEFPGGADW